MKIFEILQEQANKGTYAGIRYDEESKRSLANYIKLAKLPNGISPDKMHTTLLYSRRFCPNYQPRGMLSTPIVVKPKEFAVWDAKNEKGLPPARCLVLKLDAPELVDRHLHLMGKHNATFDFPKYEPHITLSYDIRDIDPSKLPDVIQHIKQLKAVEEYMESLDLNWTANNAGVKIS